MVFSSVSIYSDPPNWQQHHNHQHGTDTGSEDPQLPPLPPPSHVGAAGGGGGGFIRPASMADRARLAKIPQPEAALKCPRCESTNTKFCYYNNYSLSQPRHFCKTCKRYWTRGGALRNVPVGGGCRRNKKNKSSSSSKSTASAEKQGQGGSNSTNAVNSPSEITGHLPQQTPRLPFMDSLQSFPQFGLGNIGLNFSGIQGETNGSAQAEMGFQIGTHQQFPLFEPTNGLYSFQSESMEGPSSMVGESQLLRSIASSSRVSQLASVKKENNNNNNNQGLNLSRSVIGRVSENNEYWGGDTWTDLSGPQLF